MGRRKIINPNIHKAVLGMNRAMVFFSTALALSLHACSIGRSAHEIIRSNKPKPKPNSTSESPSTLNRLTNAEYINTLKSAFPKLEVKNLTIDLQEDFPKGRFSLTNEVSELHVRKYLSTAESIAKYIAANPSKIHCTMTQESCYSQVAGSLWRQELSKDDQKQIADILSTPELKTAAQKTEALVYNLLISPLFLIHHEKLKVHDSSTNAIAHRLSYKLLAKPASEKLLAMGHEALKEKAIANLLSEEKTAILKKLDKFLLEWLNLHNYEIRLSKDDSSFNSSIKNDLFLSMRKQLLYDFFDGKTNYKKLLTTQEYYVNSNISKFFDASASSSNLILTSTKRQGIFSHPFFMALSGDSDRVSFITRGVYLLRNAIGISIEAAPPGDQEAKEENADVDEDSIEGLRAATEQGSCYSCHVSINPVGLSSLNYDHLGRTIDSPFKESNKLPAASSKAFSSFDNLQEILAEDGRNGIIYRHFVSSLFEFYNGYQPSDKQVDTLVGGFAADNYNFKELFIQVILAE